METKDTTVKNVLIAEFMGLGNKQPFEICEHPKKNTDLYFENQLNYHKDWNWLMPVVEKIESLGYWTECRKQLGGVRFVIGDEKDYNYINPPIVNVYKDLKLEAVYNAVVQFIKWYNQNK